MGDPATSRSIRTGRVVHDPQNADEGTSACARTIDLTGGQPADLSFFTSYNTELDWDFVFVEAQTLNGDGQDDWTTLPEPTAHPDVTGASCPCWTEELHNHLRHYQTSPSTAERSCTPIGPTASGTPAAATPAAGSEWNIDLSQYLGQKVEISIVFATDWGTSDRPGMLVDDTKVTVNGRDHHETYFEDGTGGWDHPGRPPGGGRPRT